MGEQSAVAERIHPSALEQRFQSGTERRLAWGTGLLIAAGLCWLWSAWHTFTSYETDSGTHCSAPFHRDEEHLYEPAPRGAPDEPVMECAATRDWQSTTVPLLLSFPVAVTGVGLASSALAARRLRAHQVAVEQARGEWERGKGRPA